MIDSAWLEATAAIAAEADRIACLSILDKQAVVTVEDATLRSVDAQWLTRIGIKTVPARKISSAIALASARFDAVEQEAEMRQGGVETTPTLAERGASKASMQADKNPPSVSDAEWTRVRDRLFFARTTTSDPRAEAAREIAKAMNILQEDYSTRFTSVGIKGGLVAEHFAVGPRSFMQVS